MSDIKKRIINELYKPARVNYKRRQIVIKGLNETWQSDLAEMGKYAKENGGMRFILLVIDCFSKYLWARPLKSKSAKEVSEAMKSILEDGRVPKYLQTDMGKEYYNVKFQHLMDQFGIKHYSTYTVKKASIAERCIRTLKEKLHKQFHIQGSHKWKDILQRTVDEYNNTVHRTIKMKPKDVTVRDEKILLNTVYRRRLPQIQNTSKEKLHEGDVVRVSKEKALFEKGYTLRWSCELFKIARVRSNDSPVTYLLKDMQDQPISGCFYREEIQKTSYPEIYLIEKVLRRKGRKLYVKWLGLDKSHNSWIDSNDVK